MAKYCGNCGARMEDEHRVCGNCGTPFGTYMKTPPIKVVDPEKKELTQKKGKKNIKLCVSAAVLILVAVIVFNLIAAFTGYNGLLRKVMAAYEDYDIDALADMSSDVYYYSSADYAELYFEDTVGYALDAFESSVGHSYKLSYEVIETYKLSNRNFQSILDHIVWTYKDFDYSVIEEIVVAKVNVTATQGKRTAEREIEITMTKENGDWKVLYIG